MKSNMQTTMNVNNSLVGVLYFEGIDYISLTDLARYKNPENPGDVIIKWMSNKSSFDFYSLWEELSNEDFKLAEFREFKIDSGTQLFTQKMMSLLYDVKINTINYHINKIFEDAELEKNSVIRKFRITATDEKPYDVMHYNLQMIIAVGFRVDSERAVQFRKWVNQIAKDYTIKGWVMDDERLKKGTFLTDKYFEEQLERIREIRASERMFYQKITDIYATAVDYDKNAKATKRFYATVQNKMHYAIHGHTVAELIFERADSEKEHMGLTTWKDAPDGKIIKSDVIVAKNYLSEQELVQLNRMVCVI